MKAAQSSQSRSPFGNPRVPSHLGGVSGPRDSLYSTAEPMSAERTKPRERPPAKVEHLTTGERAARGKAARAEVPRRTHGEWQPSPQRPDPVAVLEQQAETRVSELVPIRYGRMLVSPFTFYRGAAA